jgi:threonyl-tRNA synthetase
MINLTFPDGAVRQVQAGLTGVDLAASISKSLEKKAVALMKDGVLTDLAAMMPRRSS